MGLEKKSRDELVSQVKQYEKILRNLHEGYILVDEGANIQDVNTAYCKMVGYSKEELCSMNIADLRPDMSLEDEKELVQAVIKQGSKEFDSEHRCKDGSLIHLRASAAVIQKDGKIYVAGLVRDITEFKKARKQVIQNQQRFESLFKNNPHSVYYMDLEGNYLGANAKMEELTGYSRQELLDLNFAPLIVDEDLEKTQNHFERSTRGEVEVYEIRCITKEGKEKPIRVTNFPILVHGEVTGVFGIAEDITESKEARRKLRESQQRFKSLFEHNPHPVYSFDLEGKFKEVNQKLLEFTDYSREELLQMPFDQFVDEADIERTRKHFREAKSGTPSTDELTVSVKGGEKKEIHSTKFPMYVDGEIAGVYGIIQDVTEQNRTARELQESEERWHRLVEDNPQSVFLTAEDKIIYVNKAGAELLGSSNPDDIIGRSKFDFIHPDYKEIATNHTQNAKSGGDQPVSEQKILDLQGDVKDVLIYSVRVKYKGKEAIQSVFHDITERKLAEQKIKEKENLKSAILHTALDAIVTINHEGKIIEFNRSAEQMFGHKSEDVLNKKMGDVIVPPDYREDHKKGMERYLKTRDSKIMGKRLSMEAIRADGEIFPIELTIDKIAETDPPKFTGFIRDITDRKDKENKILASLEEKKVMLQEIHHRVKNNMAVISGLLELQAMKIEDEDMREMLKDSQMRIHSMSMIHEKLYASKELSKIDFKEYVKDLSQSIINSTQKYDKEVIVRHRLDEIELNVNEAIPCGLILNELISNAFEHAFTDQESGTILIGLTEKDGEIKLWVEDNGCGLPDDFEINKQDSLGTTLISTLTKQVDGDLVIKKAEKNLGACFEIMFQK